MTQRDPPIQVMSTLGVFGPLSTQLGPAFEARTGHQLATRFDPTGLLIAAIEAGARADVVIAIDTPIAALARQGVVDPATITPIARSGVGLAVRAGAPHPDISTPESFVATLQAARAIACSRAGASGLMFARLIERLGIAEAIRAKSIVIPDGLTAERLVTGEADLAVQQISELKAVAGVEIVGPIPPPYQETITFVAALFATSGRKVPAGNFIDSLTTPEATAAFVAAGLQPPLAPGAAR